MTTWLPFIVPIVIAAFAYLGGRYQAHTTKEAARDSTQSTLLDKRDERLWAQLEAANTRLEAENARLASENTYWRDKFAELKPITNAALDKAEQSTKERSA